MLSFGGDVVASSVSKWCMGGSFCRTTWRNFVRVLSWNEIMLLASVVGSSGENYAIMVLYGHVDFCGVFD
jgi:hypothetical protein